MTISVVTSNKPAQQFLGTNVLIRTGSHDDALCYQAPIVAIQSSTSMQVVLHESSLLLDRLRLVHHMPVEIFFADGRGLVATLNLSSDMIVRLEIHADSPIANEIDFAHRLVPIT